MPPAHSLVVRALPPDRVVRIIAAILGGAPGITVVLLPDPLGAATDTSEVTTVPPAAFIDKVLVPIVERAALRARVERLQRYFAPAERVLIMMQDDPDPDPIASALALRTLLGRPKT